MMAMKMNLQFYTRTKKMSIKHKIKFKIDRDRGTNPAKGVSLDLSDEGISKPEQRLSALEGRVPDVVSPLTKMKFREHLKKFFKGEK